jgi:hypothetical protein
MRTISGRVFAVILIAALFMLSGPAAHAALSARDWQTSGDGLLTLDTATGLQWLDVTVTQGLSWNTVTSQLGADGRFTGFRRPSDAELATFWADAGIPDVVLAGATPTVANFGPVGALQQLWGNFGQLPFTPPGTTATLATTAQSLDPVDNLVEGVPLLLLFQGDGTAIAAIHTLVGIPPSQAATYLAHALVQGGPTVPVIPEPSTILLFIAGIASGASMRARWRATHI